MIDLLKNEIRMEFPDKSIKKENYKIPLVGGKYFSKLYLPKKK